MINFLPLLRTEYSVRTCVKLTYSLDSNLGVLRPSTRKIVFDSLQKHSESAFDYCYAQIIIIHLLIAYSPFGSATHEPLQGCHSSIQVFPRAIGDHRALVGERLEAHRIPRSRKVHQGPSLVIGLLQWRWEDTITWPGSGRTYLHSFSPGRSTCNPPSLLARNDWYIHMTTNSYIRRSWGGWNLDDARLRETMLFEFQEAYRWPPCTQR